MNRVYVVVRGLLFIAIVFSCFTQATAEDCDPEVNVSGCQGPNMVIQAFDCWSSDCNFQDEDGDCYYCCDVETGECF